MIELSHLEVYREPLKKEFFLNIDDFGSVSTYGELPALARLVQRLIIMEPKSYPDDPDMGVGISNYEFEFLDAITINELTLKISTQINKYIPNNNIDSVIVEAIANDKTGVNNTIGILINFVKDIEGKSNMILTFDKVGKTGKIDSKIYI